MPANIPDLGAIQQLGGQFTQNVFASAEKSLTKKSKKFAAQHVAQVRQTEANRQRFAQSVATGLRQSQARQAKTQRAQQTQAKQAAKAHAAGVKSGRVAPGAGAPPRTFAMAPTPQAKASAKAQSAQARTIAQQRNFAHGEALKFQQAQFKTQTQQRNFAHTEALKEQARRSKGSPVVAPTKTPSLTPSFSSPSVSHTPVKARKIAPATFSSQFTPQKPLQGPTGPATATFSSPERKSTMTASSAAPKPITGPQFSDVSRKENSPFPTHEHPTGSSNVILPRLTASQPKPNEFTVGSRNVQPGGIAAAGSRLEAWAQTKSMAVQARRKSAAAGGRNRQLSQTAKAWETAANQPLHKFGE